MLFTACLLHCIVFFLFKEIVIILPNNIKDVADIREIISPDNPIIITVLDHPNQFVDPLIVLDQLYGAGFNPIPVMASFSSSIIPLKPFAWLTGAIPVVRPISKLVEQGITLEIYELEGKGYALIPENSLPEWNRYTSIICNRNNNPAKYFFGKSNDESTGFTSCKPEIKKIDCDSYSLVESDSNDEYYRRCLNVLSKNGQLVTFIQGGSHDQEVIEAQMGYKSLGRRLSLENKTAVYLPISLKYKCAYNPRLRIMIYFGKPIEYNENCDKEIMKQHEAFREQFSLEIIHPISSDCTPELSSIFKQFLNFEYQHDSPFSQCPSKDTLSRLPFYPFFDIICRICRFLIYLSIMIPYYCISKILLFLSVRKAILARSKSQVKICGCDTITSTKLFFVLPVSLVVFLIYSELLVRVFKVLNNRVVLVITCYVLSALNYLYNE